MGSKPSLKAEIIKETKELSQLLTLPDDILLRIFRLLDMKTLFSRLFLTCKLFCQPFKECLILQHLFPTHLDYIYEPFMFLKEGSLIQPTPKENFQPCYFRPNVNLSFGGVKQPAGVLIHIFTISDSKEIRLEEITSIVIKLLNDSRTHAHREALEFLNRLIETSLGRLKHLKLSECFLDSSLETSLFKFSPNWPHLIYTVFGHHFRINSFAWLKRLCMKFWDDHYLYNFPRPPSSLEEISLRISGLSRWSSLVLSHCTGLKKM